MKGREMMEAKNKPVKVFRAGGVKVTVWNNPTEKGDMLNAVLIRSYKDKDGTWKETASLRHNDVPKAVLVLNKVYEYMSTAKEE